MRVDALPSAFGRELSDKPDRQRRVREDRRPDLDRDRADREEIEHVGEFGDPADRDDRDAHGLGRLVDDAQGDRLDRRPAEPAVDVAEQRPVAVRRDGDP